MILLTILGIILLILAVVAILIISTVGAAGAIIFGDLIVCMGFIVLLMRAIIKRRKRRK